MALLVVEKIVMMFLIVLVGVLCARKRIMDEDFIRKLSNFLLQIVNPIVIFVSYQMDYDAAMVKNLFLTLALAAASMAIHILIVQALIRKNRIHCSVERLSAIYGNCGFIGIPLVNSLYGREGVFYMTAYLTVFYLLLWTHGVILMAGKTDRKEVLKNLLSPAIIGVILGLICFLCRIQLPAVIVDALDSIGSTNTPLAMLVAGATLGQSSIMECLKNKGNYWVSFVKLLVVPAVIMGLLIILKVPQTIMVTIVLASGCPAGACCTMFALKYGHDGKYASQIFAMTTMFSAVTIPLLIGLSDILLGLL